MQVNVLRKATALAICCLAFTSRFASADLLEASTRVDSVSTSMSRRLSYFTIEDGKSGRSLAKPKEFWKECKASDVVIFVHGYDNSLNDSIKSAHRVQKAFQYKQVVLFSWPSKSESGNPLELANYPRQLSSAMQSGEYLMQAVESIPSDKSVFVLAHSMGTRLVAEGLKSRKGSLPENLCGIALVAGESRDDEWTELPPSTKSRVMNFYNNSEQPNIKDRVLAGFTERLGNSPPIGLRRIEGLSNYPVPASDIADSDPHSYFLSGVVTSRLRAQWFRSSLPLFAEERYFGRNSPWKFSTSDPYGDFISSATKILHYDRRGKEFPRNVGTAPDLFLAIKDFNVLSTDGPGIDITLTKAALNHNQYAIRITNGQRGFRYDDLRVNAKAVNTDFFRVVRLDLKSEGSEFVQIPSSEQRIAHLEDEELVDIGVSSLRCGIISPGRYSAKVSFADNRRARVGAISLKFERAIMTKGAAIELNLLFRRR